MVFFFVLRVCAKNEVKTIDKYKREEIETMNLENVSNEELFTELVKRLRGAYSDSVYFIDRSTSNSWKWNVHAAYSGVLIEVTEVID